MSFYTSNIAQKLKVAATLLLLLLCVCSAVARDTTRVFSKLPWGENLVAGDGYLSYYAYGHDGNRAIKMTGSAAIDQTGTLLNSTNLENITIYPNEYLTVTQGEYTKYYYAGGNRIASKIGTGGFEKMTRLCTLDQGPTYNANTLLNFVLYQVTNTTQPPTDEYPVDVCAGYSVATELLTNPLPDFYISQTNLNFTQNNLLQQFRQNLAGGTEPVYYFHSDHLGSASWITNGSGLPVQHLLYLPFGEHFVNEQSSGYFERFTFTGKERDAETGYYYHGARFNSSDIGWLSVDPQFDKLPSTTPYNYCLWNPIILHDPDGKIPVETIWDVLNVVYDLGAAAYCKIQGDDAGANEHMEDAGWDLVAVAIPYVPAGASKVVRLTTKASKAVDKGNDARKVVSNTKTLGRQAKTIANEKDVKIISYGTNDSHKPAHAHVKGGGKEVRIGPNGKPLKGQPELSSIQKQIVEKNKKEIRKELNAVGKQNKKIEQQRKQNE